MYSFPSGSYAAVHSVSRSRSETCAGLRRICWTGDLGTARALSPWGILAEELAVGLGTCWPAHQMEQSALGWRRARDCMCLCRGRECGSRERVTRCSNWGHNWSYVGIERVDIV